MRRAFAWFIVWLAAMFLLLLPVALLAAEPKLADELYSFTVASDTQVRLCTLDQSACSPPRLAVAGVGTNCGIGFDRTGLPAAPLACFAVVTTPPAPPAPPPPVTWAPFKSCWPTDPTKYRVLPVPASVGSDATHVAVWLDTCKNTAAVQMFSAAELLNVVLNAPWSKGSDAINAWIAQQPVDDRSAAETAFSLALKAQYSPHAEVTGGTGVVDRPVYKLRADGTRNTAAVAGVRAKPGMPCDIDKRIGTTSYYRVPSLGEVYAACSVVSPLG